LRYHNGVKPDHYFEIATRPQSAVSHGVGWAGLFGLVVAILLARNCGPIFAAFGVTGVPERADGAYSALVCLAFVALPMILYSIFVDKVHRRASTGIDWTLRRPMAEALRFSAVKIAGLWVTWGLIAACYSLFRFFGTNQFANFPYSMQLMQAAVIPMLVFSVPYVIWLDRHLIQPKDGSWHIGAMIARRAGWSKAEVAHHLRAWAVKGLFLAFMLSITPGGFAQVVNLNVAEVVTNPVWLANALIGAMFLIDVQFATVGYMLTLKPLDAHIRTAQPALAGWVAALICYPPFILMNNNGPLDYHVNTREWSHWLANYPSLLWIWGGILVALTVYYAWGTMAFGLRFSNLTHRGILTHGPFRWTKHPAYLSKNIFWWLSTMPFFVVGGSTTDAIRNTVILACVSGVYYWRAKTEEAHLGTDPTYRAYADWMANNAPITRFFAAIRAKLSRQFHISDPLTKLP
jgi:Isoprenylcysteine carboxyl methyltransferase (ICMT) family